MTLAPEMANSARSYVSSETIRGWSKYRREWLREQYGSAPATVSAETSIGALKQPAVDADVVREQAFRELRKKQLAAVKAAFDRVDDQASEQWTTPSVKVTGMEKWEGRVLEVDDDLFSVELTHFGEGPEVIADFARDKLAEGDEVQPGDVVYVTVRTVRAPGGPTTTSAIRLRRLGRWTEDEVADQKRRARDQLAELVNYID
ncbi:hypothetical protein C6A86_002330 [Mycobacterium sp. ITM-2016-00316]|uniref:hypothetical protein n=1 Tax=Mycobacterium sp. ITM-2016-00316 TaxID=2099695 RepID=UPI00115BDCC5|nr:hypothetical protein [Mycobacterium sp. ITM-2016-00316]WNG82561.1 hypothetical protein C6A86_002330 [Mycobacterium sp. ITM-2016-00316]